jgi:hypothetical protein
VPIEDCVAKIRAARRVNRQRDAKLCKMTEPLSITVRANDYFKSGLLAFIEKHAP